MNPAWLAIIEAIKELIPFVKEWLKKWLDAQMRTAAARLGVPHADRAKSSARLLREVHDGIPFWQLWNRRKKAFVRTMMENAPVALMGGHGLTGPESAAVIVAAEACG